MESIVQFFDRTNGTLMAELQTVAVREWRLDEPGVAIFPFPRSELLEERFILPGCWVLISSESTVPWVGQITPNRTWSTTGPNIEARQAAIALEERYYLEVDPSSNLLIEPPTLEGPVASVITQILTLANNYEDTRIRLGSLFQGGQNRQETINQDFLSHIGYIIRRAGYDYDVTPDLSSGSLLMNFNLYESKGIDTSQLFTLEEGINIELIADNGLSETTIIKNRYAGIGEGMTDETRLGVILENAASRARYGLRMGSETFSGVTELSTLQQNTAESLSQKAVWHKGLPVACNDPSLYPYLVDGNWVHVVLHSYGFLDNTTIGMDAVTRIISAEASDVDGSINLVLKDV